MIYFKSSKARLSHFFFYPVSRARGDPAAVQLPCGARHLLAPVSRHLFPAQPQLRLQSAGGGDIPHQAPATAPQPGLKQRQGHIVLHSFQPIWQKERGETSLFGEIFHRAGRSPR